MECQECGDEADSLVKVKVGRRVMKLCEDCADRKREQAEVAREAGGVMREMMEYKGK
jgi:ribosome-binding protein aMBF1 (putative translation factor)